MIARGLAGRGARLENARLRIMTCADSPGEKGRPKFPFQLARRLYEGGFPIRHGYIAAARLEALREEIPEGMAEDQRELHAKWVLLRGPSTAIILIGSANFTRKGFGVRARPEGSKHRGMRAPNSARGGGGPRGLDATPRRGGNR